MEAMSRIPCAFSCQKEFLAMVDRRAASLGMNRTAYIIQLLRQDLMTGKPNLNIMSQQMVINGDMINHHGQKVAAVPSKYGNRKRAKEGKS